MTALHLSAQTGDAFVALLALAALGLGLFAVGWACEVLGEIYE